MTVEQSFVHNGEHYALIHINEDDSRAVVDDEGVSVLTFDSSLGVRDRIGLVIGRLTAPNDSWTLVRSSGEVEDLRIPLRDYHWRQIVQAEVAAAKALLQ